MSHNLKASCCNGVIEQHPVAPQSQQHTALEEVTHATQDLKARIKTTTDILLVQSMAA